MLRALMVAASAVLSVLAAAPSQAQEQAIAGEVPFEMEKGPATGVFHGLFSPGAIKDSYELRLSLILFLVGYSANCGDQLPADAPNLGVHDFTRGTETRTAVIGGVPMTSSRDTITGNQEYVRIRMSKRFYDLMSKLTTVRQFPEGAGIMVLDYTRAGSLVSDAAWAVREANRQSAASRSAFAKYGCQSREIAVLEENHYRLGAGLLSLQDAGRIAYARALAGKLQKGDEPREEKIIADFMANKTAWRAGGAMAEGGAARTSWPAGLSSIPGDDGMTYAFDRVLEAYQSANRGKTPDKHSPVFVMGANGKPYIAGAPLAARQAGKPVSAGDLKVYEFPLAAIDARYVALGMPELTAAWYDVKLRSMRVAGLRAEFPVLDFFLSEYPEEAYNRLLGQARFADPASKMLTSSAVAGGSYLGAGSVSGASYTGAGGRKFTPEDIIKVMDAQNARWKQPDVLYFRDAEGRAYVAGRQSYPRAGQAADPGRAPVGTFLIYEVPLAKLEARIKELAYNPDDTLTRQGKAVDVLTKEFPAWELAWQYGPDEHFFDFAKEAPVIGETP